MSSILTNQSAMTALTVMRSINEQMSITQNRISTGKEVSSAADNAAYWSISTTMGSDKSTLDAITKSLGMGSSQIDAASTGISSLVSLVSSVRDRVAASAQAGIDKGKIQNELSQLFSQMETVLKSSSVNGVNLLTQAGDNIDFISGVSRDAVAADVFSKITVSLKATTIATNASGIYDTIKGISVAADTDSSATAASMVLLDKAAKSLTELGTVFGAATSRIKLQTEFIGALVDADMDSESVKLKALQTQQQLAVQALSIANSNTQNILSLFRN
jgi:flagellin